MYKIKITGTIDLNLVNRLLKTYPNRELCLVIDNTKYQSPEKLEEIASVYGDKITISVFGGLVPNKEKFNNEYYQKRTYHSPLELSKIIKIFQRIERGLSISWTETQKTMWIYNELCNCMEYDELKVDGKDVSRSLSGLLHGKAVCSGFALILKEALDRVGIKCFYQNVESSHSWVIAYLDGAYRALELTWDCYNKGKDGCRFRYFNRIKNFYQESEHNIANEKEEREYPIVPYTVDELNNCVDVVSKKTRRVPLDKNVSVSIKGVGPVFEIRNGNVKFLNKNVRKFVRNDGSVFYIINTGTYKTLNKFYYFIVQNDCVRGTTIYSEAMLDRLPMEYDYDIANGLLSKERITRKISQFNGYVGYISTDRRIIYDSNIEREELNVIR